MLLIDSSLHGLRWFNRSLLLEILLKLKLLRILVSTQLIVVFNTYKLTGYI